MREITLRGAAKSYYQDVMSPLEHGSIQAAFDRLEHGPVPDGRTSFAVPGIPSQILYDDGEWQMHCILPDDASLVIRTIAHALDLPD